MQDGNANNIIGFSIDELKNANMGLNYIVGVIDSSEASRFKRIIFRVTKGNAWTETIQINTN